MRTPEAAAVDRALARAGEIVVLRRTGLADLPVRAFVRGYKASELIGGIVQGDRTVIIGNTEIAAAAWPGPPVKPDYVMIAGKSSVVQSCDVRRVAGVIVCHIIQVRG